MSGDSVAMTQRMDDIAFMQRWRSENSEPGSIAFSVVYRLMEGMRAEPLVSSPAGDEPAPKARVRTEVIVGILEEILLAKAIDGIQEADGPLALTGHLISKLQALGVDLS